ncbi:hypothetical protein D3C73_1438200 [compost metagenome]
MEGCDRYPRNIVLGRWHFTVVKGNVIVIWLTCRIPAGIGRIRFPVVSRQTIAAHSPRLEVLSSGHVLIRSINVRADGCSLG